MLSFTRAREESTRAFAENFNSTTLGVFVVFLKYGPVFLNPAESPPPLQGNALQEYYLELGQNALRIRSREFWKYHEDTLAAFSARIHYWLVMGAAITHGAKVCFRAQSIISKKRLVLVVSDTEQDLWQGPRADSTLAIIPHKNKIQGRDQERVERILERSGKQTGSSS